jgi:hypothetical protein
MRAGSKISAGALQFVLFMGALIAVLLSTFVILAHTHSFFGKKTELFIDTIKSSELGLELALKREMPVGDTVLLEQTILEGIDLRAVKEYWGTFEKYSVVSSTAKNRFQKIYLVGGKAISELPALYLNDNKRPLIIVGRAKITGDALLPEMGIRPGNISGHSYHDRTLVHGRQLASGPKPLPFDAALMAHISQLTGMGLTAPSEQQLSPNGNTSYYNSFATPTHYLYGSDLYLADRELTGNIMVVATRRIVVNPSARLRDVLLVAPEIIINDGVYGIFQAVAGKRIQLGRQCTLGYPSALIVNEATTVLPNDSSMEGPNIELGTGSSIKGIVRYSGGSGTGHVYPQIKIGTGSTVIGEVYCERNLELEGGVTGSVTTNAFMARANGSTYMNHLYNGSINAKSLPKQFVGLSKQGNERIKAVSKWLY